MAKAKTITELKDLRTQLETEVNQVQTDMAAKLYLVDLESTQNVNAILKQIDKSYTWNIKNAAFLVNLYDSISDQKKLKANVDMSRLTMISLNSIQINTLYTVLTNVTGNGIEAARTFTRLLTNVGSQISEALREMAEDNRVIQEKHVTLAELDVKIENMAEPILDTVDVTN
jgi:phosphoenolpyruvate carboxylase